MESKSATVLEEQTEPLYRQVHPNFVQEGKPTSVAFRPNSGDEGKLSSDRGSMVTPREAFEEYLKRQLASAGVWSVLVGECGKEDLPCFADPIEDNDAHAIVDFTAHDTKQWEKIGKKLKAYAIKRSRLFPEEDAA